MTTGEHKFAHLQEQIKLNEDRREARERYMIYEALNPLPPRPTPEPSEDTRLVTEQWIQDWKAGKNPSNIP
jgi:hypothetical protein